MAVKKSASRLTNIVTATTGYVQTSTKGPARSSSATSYLAPNYRSRKNLDILLGARVSRVLQTGRESSVPAFRGVEFRIGADGMPCTGTHLFLLCCCYSSVRIRSPPAAESVQGGHTFCRHDWLLTYPIEFWNWECHGTRRPRHQTPHRPPRRGGEFRGPSLRRCQVQQHGNRHFR